MHSDLRLRAPLRFASVLLTAVVIASCSDDLATFPAGVQLSAGTWGGENAGLIVHGDGAHAHIGCTLGDIKGFVEIDNTGHFEVEGTYVLRAYPVQQGPSLPARYNGRVAGNFLELTISVNDTVEHRTVVLGPVTLQYGRDPNMGPCPICRMTTVEGRTVLLK